MNEARPKFRPACGKLLQADLIFVGPKDYADGGLTQRSAAAKTPTSARRYETPGHRSVACGGLTQFHNDLHASLPT